MAMILSNPTQLPYRQNVQMILFNPEGKLLVNDESKPNEVYWKFPQGGIEKGETNEKAIARELKEELNITHYQIIQKLSFTHRYDWDAERQKIHTFRGQEQHIYLVKPLKLSEIKICEKNILTIEWLTFEQVLNRFHVPNQIEVTKRIWNEFKPMIEKEMEKKL